jgi:hypothetical protein
MAPLKYHCYWCVCAFECVLLSVSVRNCFCVWGCGIWIGAVFHRDHEKEFVLDQSSRVHQLLPSTSVGEGLGRRNRLTHAGWRWTHTQSMTWMKDEEIAYVRTTDGRRTLRRANNNEIIIMIIHIERAGNMLSLDVMMKKREKKQKQQQLQTVKASRLLQRCPSLSLTSLWIATRLQDSPVKCKSPKFCPMLQRDDDCK